MKKLSIHDIARELNVSATTVSFVLNGRSEEKRISSNVKKSVLEYVQKVGYAPNRVARSLRTGKTKTFGMLVEYISDPFFAIIARGVEECVHNLGYKIIFSSTKNDTQRTSELIKMLRESQVDGYIIAPSPGVEDDLKELMNENKPVIVFDRYFPSIETHNVVIDNYEGVYKAVQHLWENGYRKIGFVTLESEQIQMKERLEAYLDVISEKGLIACVKRVPFEAGHDAHIKMIKTFLEEYSSVLDAAIFATNYLTISGLEAMKELSMIIPQDIAVISFDDDINLKLFSPSITAIAQPTGEISKMIADRMMACLADKELPKKTVKLSTNLIVRDSTIKKT